MNNEILREDLMEEKTIGKPETTSELIQERRAAQRAAAARKSKRATITAVATAVLATATATVIMVFASCGANKTSSNNKTTSAGFVGKKYLIYNRFRCIENNKLT